MNHLYPISHPMPPPCIQYYTPHALVTHTCLVAETYAPVEEDPVFKHPRTLYTLNPQLHIHR